MPGNHLFGSFRIEKLKKVIPPHRVPGGPGEEPRRQGIAFSAVSAPAKLKKVFPQHRGPGRSQMWGNHLFRSLSHEKLKKVIPPHWGPVSAQKLIPPRRGPGGSSGGA